MPGVEAEYDAVLERRCRRRDGEKDRRWRREAARVAHRVGLGRPVELPKDSSRSGEKLFIQDLSLLDLTESLGINQRAPYPLIFYWKSAPSVFAPISKTVGLQEKSPIVGESFYIRPYLLQHDLATLPLVEYALCLGQAVRTSQTPIFHFLKFYDYFCWLSPRHVGWAAFRSDQ